MSVLPAIADLSSMTSDVQTTFAGCGFTSTGEHGAMARSSARITSFSSRADWRDPGRRAMSARRPRQAPNVARVLHVAQVLHVARVLQPARVLHVGRVLQPAQGQPAQG